VTEEAIRRARITILAIFFLHGAVFATWASRIPAVKSQIGLSAAQLGLALLGVAAGSLISMPIAGYLIGRHGSRAATAISSLCFSAALFLPGLAFSQWTLAASLCVLGSAAGAMDVSMNTHALAIERVAGRPILSGIHASFSIGGIAGASLGGLVASLGIAPRIHFAAVAIIAAATVLAAAPGLLPGHVDAAPQARGRLRITPALAGLSALTFCFFLAEGAVADWSGLYLHGSALGYALFSGAMAIGRLGGDKLRHRIAPEVLVRLGSATAATGLALGLAIPVVGPIGFAIVGAGCSIVVPVVFAAAGSLNGGNTGAAIAFIIMSGAIGLFAGPPAIGFAAEAFTLRVALLIVVGLTAAGVALAPAVAAAAAPSRSSPALPAPDSWPQSRTQSATAAASRDTLP
jgi:MFS family permease